MSQTDFDWGRYPIEGDDISIKNTSVNAMNLQGQAGGLLVKLDSANYIGTGSPVNTVMGAILTTAVTDIPLGLTIEDIPVGITGRIQTLGFGLGTAYAAIAGGAMVGASGTTNGFLIAYTATDPYLGQACNVAATNGDPVFVHLMPGVTA